MAVWLDTLELAGFARRVVLTAGQAGQFGMKGTCSEHATGHNVDVSKAKVSVRASVIVTIVCLASLDLCGVSYGGETRSSSSQSGSPGHPQILTCSEEATQFTGTLLPAGPHDLIFGPGYFPEARSLATESPQHFAPGAHGTYKLPPVVDPGSTVTMTVALTRAVLRRTTESVVIARRKPVGHLRSLSGQAGFFSAELPIHGWATSRVRSD